uniref:Flagellar assembly protein T C-terminal domain-containing protein n=1 Tax=Desulfobacca acetoxidans TaxID=60893 RepID=A0A7C3WG34_9BACT
MPRKFICLSSLFMVVALLASGCGAWQSVKKWAGYGVGEEDAEATVPPEAVQETIMVDGKPYVRSKNPYYLILPDQPEYIYAEKGTEFKGVQAYLMEALAKRVAREQSKAAAKGVPPEKLQEMVRAEVDRILREQGLGSLVARAKGERVGLMGRAVGIIPDPDAPSRYAGANQTLALALAEVLGRHKDIKVAPPDKVRAALAKAGVHGKLSQPSNIRALGDYLGVQALILTGVVPPEKTGVEYLSLEIYDTYYGRKADAVLGPVGKEGVTPEAVKRFAQDNALRVSAELLNIDWFGRVEFVQGDRVYLSLGQNAGLKVGDRLRVVEPGQEVVSPKTQASMGYGADVPKGELKVTELLGDSGAVATVVSGGPFKPNEKVKAVR